MTRVLKITAMIGAVLIAIGVLLAIIGSVLGGAAFLRNYNYYGNGWYFQRWGIHDSEKYEEKYDVFRNGTETEKQVTTVDPFQTIVVKGRVLEFDLKPSENEQFEVKVNSSLEIPKPAFQVENGTLTVKSRWPSNLKENLDNGKYHVTVMYPKSAVFNSLVIDLDVGDVDIDNFFTDQTEIKLNVGDVELKDSDLGELTLNSNVGALEAKRCSAQTAGISLDLGSVEAKDFDTAELNLVAKLGSVEWSGTLEGNSSIRADMGSVELTPTLSRDDYYIEVTGLHESKIGQPGTENQLFVKCALGSVDLSFG